VIVVWGVKWRKTIGVTRPKKSVAKTFAQLYKCSMRSILVVRNALMLLCLSGDALLLAEEAKFNKSAVDVSLIADKSTIMLGEPLYLSFVVNNKTNHGLDVWLGGDEINDLTRPDQFTV
jgi:hypothetical protein